MHGPQREHTHMPSHTRPSDRILEAGLTASRGTGRGCVLTIRMSVFLGEGLSSVATQYPII